MTGAAPALASYLDATLGPDSGPWELSRLTGGNSNETILLRGKHSRYIMRRPPQHALSASAHNMTREFRVLRALVEGGVPVPRPIADCADSAVPSAPFQIMEFVPDAVSITDRLPDTYGDSALTRLADEVVDALAAVHRLDWQAVGLGDFGRPRGFLERQADRWYGQWTRIACRPLPVMEPLADWLRANRPADVPPALVHGDFHVDNCLFAAAEPRLLAVIDWEMATIGDPLLDLGLLLAFWGERVVEPPAMRWVQGVSRLRGAPPREYLLERYEQATGQRVPHEAYYRCLAFFKLAAIVESAYAQYVAGDLDTPYAASLGADVPALLEEAAAAAGIATGEPHNARRTRS